MVAYFSVQNKRTLTNPFIILVSSSGWWTVKITCGKWAAGWTERKTCHSESCSHWENRILRKVISGNCCQNRSSNREKAFSSSEEKWNCRTECSNHQGKGVAILFFMSFSHSCYRNNSVIESFNEIFLRKD